jgi:outer membrane protein OmpA-like peptidoglycan-associated protein
MIQDRIVRCAFQWMLLMVVAAVSASAADDTKKVEGLIIGRSGSTMIVKTADSPNLLVVLTDTTRVGQVKGVLQARKKDMSMAALIPGLAVRIEGSYSTPNELVAKSISFKGNDLERAESIQAGLHETKAQTEQHKEELARQREALQQQQQNITENKAAIDAAIARFGQLDDYYIFDEITIYFGNGKVALASEYEPKLRQLAEKAKTIDGYMIQIIGHASSTGSATLNQKLSEDRANTVATFMMQQCDIPLTNLLAPGAMGETRQVGNNTTAEGQAQNRRVVVRVLQNKGIAGL